MARTAAITWLALAACAACGDGLYSYGNTDGVLIWSLGDLGSGAEVREVVTFVSAPSVGEAPALVRAARERAEHPLGHVPLSPKLTPQRLWLDNGVTDFAIEDAGYFRWGLERQALRCDLGGQLSQFCYYLHYRDGAGAHKAGAPNVYELPLENLRVAEALGGSGTEGGCVVETEDGLLRARITATVGPGPCASVEFVVTSAADHPVDDVRLGIYANVEAAHDHENDLSRLDPECDGLLVEDPATGRCVVVAATREPLLGWSGVWNSLPKLQNAEGIPRAEWRSLDDLPAEERVRVANVRVQLMAPPGIYLPYSYDNPTTPETRALTPAEARGVLEADWLFQAEGQPLDVRARAETGWALALAARLSCDPRTPDLGEQTRELARLSERLNAAQRQPLSPDEAREAYLQVRRIKREIMFRNPVIDFSQVLLIDQPQPRGPVNDTHESIHRMGITATPGGRLLVLDGLAPGGAVRQLAPDKPGSFWQPDLSFDATRVLFCFKPWDGKSFHLYEVGVDGTGLRRLTDSDYDDVDPIYLPDGHIMFTSTRGNSYVRCGPFIYSYTLARCDADGGNVYLISQNGEPDFVPSLMSDGRVVYSRWEYSDRPLWRIQSLWTTHPDGTNTQALWGNRSVWPDHLSEPRQIPGSQRIMFSGVGHHDWFSGSIGIVDPSRGMDFPDGLTKVTADRPWPECGTPPLDPTEAADYHGSGQFTGYKTAYPLSEEDFLVSARGQDGKFRLYLMDVHGNRELVYEGAFNVWHAIPVRPRPVPPALPSSVVWPGTGAERKKPVNGCLYSADVYQGVSEVPRGAAKYLRVMQLDHKTYSTWRKTFRHSGPAVSIVQEEGVKRVLSIVPVEQDGSASFEVPPGRSVYFQLLDSEYRCIQSMRSFTGVMPGERRGCVGCHESHSTAPPSQPSIALSRPPTPLSPPEWGTESISFERFVQPTLDRYCGSCHQGDGSAEQVLDLTLRPGADVFKEPYLTLVGSAGWGNPVAPTGQPGYGCAGAIPVESMDPTMNDPRALETLKPMTHSSYTSPLVMLVSSGEHYGVRVDDVSLRKLMTWVDACCPFMGEDEIRALGDPDFRGIDLLPIRPRVATAPVVERP